MSDKLTRHLQGAGDFGVRSARRLAQMCMAFIEDEGRERDRNIRITYYRLDVIAFLLHVLFLEASPQAQAKYNWVWACGKALFGT